MSKTDAALSLESDRLEQYLETATPAQPVVVIQYRNRGVSSWVFFTLLVVIPLGAILIYHRLVVERYRVQAMIESRRARAVAAPSPAQTTVVPAPAAVTTAVSPAPVPAPQLPGAAQSEAHAPAPDPAPTQAQENSALIAASAQPSPPAESPPTGAGKKREPRLRTILPNPFAPDDHPTAASTKPDGTALAALAGTVRASAGDPSSEPGAESKGRQVRSGSADTLAGPAAVRDGHATGPVKDRRPAGGDRKEVLPAVQPLPSREESERQIAAEAAKIEAEMLARVENREAEARARRYEDRVKFREELREILRIHGNDGGAEIDKLAKRYGFDVGRARYEHARTAWVYGGMSRPAKVRMMRSLELPEAVILDFLSDDLYPKVRTPNGPRNKDECRVRAARQLLGFPFPTADPAVPPGAGAGPERTRTPTAPATGPRPRPQ